MIYMELSVNGIQLIENQTDDKHHVSSTKVSQIPYTGGSAVQKQKFSFSGL